MSAHYQILHDTHYHYDSPVSLAQQLAHLWPRCVCLAALHRAAIADQSRPDFAPR